MVGNGLAVSFKSPYCFNAPFKLTVVINHDELSRRIVWFVLLRRLIHHIFLSSIAIDRFIAIVLCKYYNQKVTSVNSSNFSCLYRYLRPHNKIFLVRIPISYLKILIGKLYLYVQLRSPALALGFFLCIISVPFFTSRFYSNQQDHNRFSIYPATQRHPLLPHLLGTGLRSDCLSLVAVVFPCNFLFFRK